MLPVEILPVQETIVLRARGSELLILPHHVKKLKGMAKPRDFSQYFRAEALVNRPARKLFEAWLRKDHTLWPRLYKTVHAVEIAEGSGDEADVADDAPEVRAAPSPATLKTTFPPQAKAPGPAPKAPPKAAPVAVVSEDDEVEVEVEDAKPAKAKAKAPEKEPKKPEAKAKVEPAKKPAKPEPKAKAVADTKSKDKKSAKPEPKGKADAKDKDKAKKKKG